MNEVAEHKKVGNGNFMTSLATFIVDKRNLFFLIVILGFVFSLFSTGWVQVENSLAEFLPDDSESRQGLTIMEDQFVTYGTAEVMVANITLTEAQVLYEELCDLDGVQSITFNETEDHYKNAAALYVISFDYPNTNPACEEALAGVEAHLKEYDHYVVTATTMIAT